MTLDTEEIEQRERIAKEIARTSEAIRKKRRTLKTGRDEQEVRLRKRLKPIVEPLQKIAENIEPVREKRTRKKQEITPEKISKDDSIGENSFARESPNLGKERKRWSSLQDSVDSTLKPEMFSTPLESAEDREKFATAQKLTFDESPSFETTRVQGEKYTMFDQISPLGKAAYRKMGPLGREYIGELLTAGAKSNIDNVYGVYFDDAGTFLGDKPFDIDASDNLIVDGVKYAGTRGLYELIFKKVPLSSTYTDEDTQTYRNLLLATNAYRRGRSELGSVLGNRGYKYKHVIAPLIGDVRKGRGVARNSARIPRSTNNERIPRSMTVTDNAVDYVHWDDPNELVDRLRLLDASHQAGNNAHDNEFLSIIEELREAGLIIN